MRKCHNEHPDAQISIDKSVIVPAFYVRASTLINLWYFIVSEMKGFIGHAILDHHDSSMAAWLSLAGALHGCVYDRTIQEKDTRM